MKKLEGSTAKVMKGYEVCLVKAVRSILGVKKADRVQFWLHNGDVIIRKVVEDQ